MKLSNVSVADRVSVFTMDDMILPLDPTTKDKVLVVNTELGIVKPSQHLFKVIYSIGYSKTRILDKVKTFRDTFEVMNSNLFNSESVKLSVGLQRKIKFENLPIYGLLSAKLFGRYNFDNRNSSKSVFSTFDNVFVEKRTRVTIAPLEYDFGTEINASFLYNIGSRFSIGLGISQFYTISYLKGTRVEETVRINDKVEIISKERLFRKQNEITFFDTTNFSLIFSYSFG